MTRRALAGVMLLGLLALTAWNVTRSDAIERARSAYVQGKLPVCLVESLSHLRRRPWDREAVLLAARCLSRMDRAEDAEPYYRRAGTLSLDDLQIRAFGLVRCNLREQAVAAYESILERWPNNVTAMRRLAAVEFSRTNELAVRKLADRLIATPDGAAIGYTLLGVVNHNNRDWAKGAEAFERVLKIDPELKTMPLPRRLFWSHLATDLCSCNRTEDGGRYLARAIAAEPDAYLANFLGKIYDQMGDTDQAEQCFRQGAEWDPTNYAPFLFLGKLALYRRDYPRAEENLERAVRLAPRQYDAVMTLAQYYRQTGRVDDAAILQKRAEKLREPGPSPAGTLPRYAL